MTLLALGFAALAAVLLVGPVEHPATGSSVTAERTPGSGRPVDRRLVVGLSCGGVLLGWARPQVAVLVALGVGVLVAAGLLWRRRRQGRFAVEQAGCVLETCQTLAAELAAGAPPGHALEQAARVWPPLAPVAEAFRVGADVPDALRRLADGPGCHDLRFVAAAWQVAHRTGQGLADAMDRVADGLRSAQASRRVVESELSSARATARLVAGLPVLALAMGSGAGGDPWGFLLGTPLGLACLGGGLTFAFVGVWWIESLARDVDRTP